jgi:hypothetical protein
MNLATILSLSNTFNGLFDSEKFSDIVLLICAATAILFTNSLIGRGYSSFNLSML